MGRFNRLVTGLALAGLALCPLWHGSARAQGNPSPLTVGSGEAAVHILPTTAGAKGLAPFIADAGPLLYNGGPIMPRANTYAIFWLPPTLQDGVTPSFMSAGYRPIIRRFLADYPGHGIDNNNTQYSQGGGTGWIHNAGAFAGAFIDTSPYPASGCSDSFNSTTAANCLTDLQIRHEIKKVIALKAWPVGLTSMFMVFTSQGEGSCFDSSNTVCSYVIYCAYHGHIGTGSTAIIYGNMPYADTSVCQLPSEPSPNGDADGDDAATITSHELTEAITDPLLNAWYSAQGNEIGDLCAYDYGTLGWDSGNANEMWNGHFYLLQQEFDNFASGCTQVGP